MDIKIKDIDLTFDLEKISMTEYRQFSKGNLLDEEDDLVLAKTSGQPVEFFRGLSQVDYRRVVTAFFKKAREPLADPNSPSGSISQ